MSALFQNPMLLLKKGRGLRCLTCLTHYRNHTSQRVHKKTWSGPLKGTRTVSKICFNFFLKGARPSLSNIKLNNSFDKLKDKRAHDRTESCPNYQPTSSRENFPRMIRRRKSSFEPGRGQPTSANVTEPSQRGKTSAHWLNAFPWEVGRFMEKTFMSYGEGFSPR